MNDRGRNLEGTGCKTRRCTTRQGNKRGWVYLFFGLLLLVFAAALPTACGEATENPEDCRSGEFFDEANERCTACPAVSEPDCEPGRCIKVGDDDRECPVLECADDCGCSPDEFFSSETFDCEECAASSDPPAICFEDNPQDDE